MTEEEQIEACVRATPTLAIEKYGKLLTAAQIDCCYPLAPQTALNFIPERLCREQIAECERLVRR